MSHTNVPKSELEVRDLQKKKKKKKKAETSICKTVEGMNQVQKDNVS